MDFEQPPELDEIRAAVRELCSRFPGEYWRELEPDGYPTDFVRELTTNGWLAALIPEEYGGAGLGITAASAILEEINASGGNSGACHAQMYTMGTILRHGSDEQKLTILPSRHISVRSVSPGNTGAENRHAKATSLCGS